MSKATLIIDEINLLLNSEEPKNANLYGNLYDVLLRIKKIKAISLDELKNNYGLDKVGEAAITYNKQSLMDNVKEEWYVEADSSEDLSQKVRCGLCNTPNKYLFFIRNRINHTRLNVGSYCMTKFPGIEGYTEYKYHLTKIIKNQQSTERRTQFHNKFPNVIDILDSSSFFFDTLPILLPYELYYKLQDTIKDLRMIYVQYIKYGKKPFVSEKNSFDLFAEKIKDYNALKKQAESFVSNNKEHPYICKRDEIDWMITNKQIPLLNEIAKNRGLYTQGTVAKVYSYDFIRLNFEKFIKHNISKNVKINNLKNESQQMMQFSVEKNGYGFLFYINNKKFMNKIGANCIFDSSFKYGEEEIFKVSEIAYTEKNLHNALDSLSDTINKFGFFFVIDDDTNNIYIYKKKDKSVKLYSFTEFVKMYSKFFIQKSIDIYRFISFITSKGWITFEEQERQGIDEKIGKLYYQQYIEPYK